MQLRTRLNGLRLCLFHLWIAVGMATVGVLFVGPTDARRITHERVGRARAAYRQFSG